MTDDLAANVRSFVEEDLVLAADDIRREMRSNKMTFSFDPPVDGLAVRHALLDVGSALRAMLGARSGPVSFYAWYDEMAGYLCCSVASVSVDSLPFYGAITVVDDPAEVVAHMAADPHPGVIPLDEFVRVDAPSPDAPDVKPATRPLSVFAMPVAESQAG